MSISYDFPLAIGLETAALVIEAADAGTPEQLTSCWTPPPSSGAAATGRHRRPCPHPVVGRVPGPSRWTPVPPPGSPARSSPISDGLASFLHLWRRCNDADRSDTRATGYPVGGPLRALQPPGGLDPRRPSPPTRRGSPCIVSSSVSDHRRGGGQRLAVSLTATSYVGPSAAVPAGPSGPAIVLEDQASLSGGVDAATDPSTDISYVGWISDNATNPQLREVHLCVLAIEAKGCAGGVLTASAIDGASAAGIQVEVTAPGVVTLVWWHQSGLTTGMLATATYANGALAPSADVAAAPSNGGLFDVVTGPDGQLWALTHSDSGIGQNLQVRAGLTGAPQPLTAPWLVGHARWPSPAASRS